MQSICANYAKIFLINRLYHYQQYISQAQNPNFQSQLNLAKILFSNFRIKLKKLPTRKLHFDKKTKLEGKFLCHSEVLELGIFICLDYAYHKLKYFNSIMTLALKTNAPMKRVFIRNDLKNLKIQSDSLVKIYSNCPFPQIWKIFNSMGNSTKISTEIFLPKRYFW